jgi:hypothetical protein
MFPNHAYLQTVRFAGRHIRNQIAVGLWLLSVSLLHSQPQPPADPQAVLNLHADFVNESLHLLWVLQPALEAHYQQARHEFPQGQATFRFAARRLLRQELYRGVLLGICRRQGGATSGPDNLRRLYQELQRRTAELPDQAAAALAPRRDALFAHVEAILQRCDSLHDPLTPEQIFTHLPFFHFRYRQVADQVEGIREVLSRWHTPMPAPLQGLHDLVIALRQSADLFRMGDPTALRRHLHRLQGHRRRVQHTLAHLPDSSALFPVREHTGYQYLLRYADRVMVQLDSCLATWPTTHGQREAQYQRLVRLFNHQHNGLIAYYNQFLSLARPSLRRLLEVPPWLHLGLAPLPLKAPAVSLFGDSLRPARPVPLPWPTQRKGAQFHLVVLVDVSASMGQGERLPRLKQELLRLSAGLRPGDRLTLLRYAGGVEILIEAAGPQQQAELQAAIEQLRAGGRTRLGKGLRQAYRLGHAHFLPESHNRILIATDGAAELGKRLRRQVRREANSQLSLSVWVVAEKVSAARQQAWRQLTELGQGYLITGPEADLGQQWLEAFP